MAACTALLVLIGCTADPDPEAQPAPEVTTFEEGRFGQIPLVPRSDPVGDRREEDGVVARSFRAYGTTPEDVIAFYESSLPDQWSMASEVEQLGPQTFRADWATGEYRLRVSTSPAPTLDDEDAGSNDPVVQYSLSLRVL